MDANYNLLDPFWIDDNELKGFSKEYAFVMGAEFMMFRQMLQLTEATRNTFIFMCLKGNEERLEKLADRHGRISERRDINVKGWMEIYVGGSKPQKKE